ncbi:MAG: tripartite tricarboxylate transporter substrate-binding protein [Verrucomicrobiota bacterium]
MFLLSGCDNGEREKPIRVVVPFAPGGGSDTLARVLAREVEAVDKGGPSWVILNVPGAGGTIGSRRVKNARPDGRTLLFLHDGLLTAKYAGQALYGPEAFLPIAATGQVGMVLCVATGSEFSSLRGLLEAAAEEPDSVTFSANIGAPSYFMARKVEQVHGKAQFRYVQSGGGARRFADLSGGHVVASAFSVSEYLNFREGGIKALAILSENRHPALEEVPTALEEDLPILYTNLQGWWAPRGTTPETVNNLQESLQSAFASPAMQSHLQQQCIDPVFLNSDGLSAAMEEKKQSLETLDLEFEEKTLPPIEITLGVAVFFGVSLAWVGRTNQSALPADPAWKGGKTPLLAFLVFAFVTSLALPGPLFLPAGVLFVFLITILSVGREHLSTTCLVSVLAPATLYLFLSSLLGIELP